MNKHIKKKRFGQNFLTDKHVLSNIFGFIDPKADDIFLEIGPGSGSMTETVSYTHLTLPTNREV